MRAFEVHTSNIANANVPNFKAKKIEFEERMREALEAKPESAPLAEQNRVLSQHIKNVEADVVEDPLAPMNGNGNTVDPDREQTEIAKNKIAYDAAVQLMNKKFAMQKYVVTEGGR